MVGASVVLPSKEISTMTRLDAETPNFGREGEILTPEAVQFLCLLQSRFAPCRQELLFERDRRQRTYDLGQAPDSLPVIEHSGETDWGVRPPFPDQVLGQVMLACPPASEVLSRGAGSGAVTLIADFDDCLSPTWPNCLESHACLQRALDRAAAPAASRGPAVVSVRPRNWSLEEKHFLAGGESISASLFDFGLSIFHIARNLQAHPTVAHFSLAKLESRQEARLWADIFRFAERHLGIPQGFIRVMVTIDTISAASEMEEVVFELRDYVTALECSPVSYLASFVRSFRAHGASLLPQRSDISMNQPFLQAYRELLVHTCLKHKLRAISSSLQQFRTQDDAGRDHREQARVSLDIQHEIELGFDGICVADPSLIPVALSTFKQPRRHRPTGPAVAKCHITARDLISPSLGRITMTALKDNVESALVYLEGWLGGRGSALGARGLKSMASAELCRAQLWQWLRHSAPLAGGHRVSRYVIECLIRDSLASIETRVGGVEFAASRFPVAAEVLLSSCTDDFDAPLALRAYSHLY
jgi:malate synthase